VSYVRPQCFYCKHFITRGKTRQCKAFEEIPREIYFNEFDHAKPYKGDNGIQFEPREEEKK
jgi:hypothetical protein